MCSHSVWRQPDILLATLMTNREKATVIFTLLCLQAASVENNSTPPALDVNYVMWVIISPMTENTAATNVLLATQQLALEKAPSKKYPARVSVVCSQLEDVQKGVVFCVLCHKMSYKD